MLGEKVKRGGRENAFSYKKKPHYHDRHPKRTVHRPPLQAPTRALSRNKVETRPDVYRIESPLIRTSIIMVSTSTSALLAAVAACATIPTSAQNIVKNSGMDSVVDPSSHLGQFKPRVAAFKT